MKTWRRRAIWGLASVLVALAFVAWMVRAADLDVDLVAVVERPLEVTVRDEGETRVRDRYVVTAPVAGALTRLTLREGDTVKPGSEVAHLDVLPLDERARAQATAALEGARDHHRTAVAMVNQSRDALAQSRRDAARVATLLRAGAVSHDALEQAELSVALRTRELEAADSRAQAAAHDVEAARSALMAADQNRAAHTRHVIVRAPAAGRILRVPQPSARIVAAGEPLLEIGDATRLEITADLVSTDAVKVRPGQAMYIEGWGEDKALHGRVRLVEPSGFTKVSALGIEEQRVNVIGDLLDACDSLGDRYRVQVRIVIWRAERVLTVPWSALVRERDGWRVFVADRGRARARTVVVGQQGEFDVQIVEGLRAGEQVVRHPSDRVIDGARIRVP
jgi:HlyD family secretion protein